MASITASALRAEIISTRTSTNALASSHLHSTAGPSLPLRSAVGGRPSKRMIVRAADDKSNTATQERAADVANQMASQGPSKLNEALKDLPAEQQKAISQLYLFLIQNPSHNIQFRGWPDVQRAIAEDYQVLIWRPAELLNGRMAMIGFLMGSLIQARTGVSVWGQLNAFPFAYLAAYGLVVTAGLLNASFGNPREGISVGPIKFSQQAELLNGRMAMVGYAILAYIGYNQDLARGIIQLLRAAQASTTGVST